jgi:hypothetical protein
MNMQKDKESFLENNELLEEIENGEDYTETKKVFKEVLQEQREDLIISGIIASLFLKF